MVNDLHLKKKVSRAELAGAVCLEVGQRVKVGQHFQGLVGQGCSFLWAKLESMKENCQQVAFKTPPPSRTIWKGEKVLPTKSR